MLTFDITQATATTEHVEQASLLFQASTMAAMQAGIGNVMAQLTMSCSADRAGFHTALCS